MAKETVPRAAMEIYHRNKNEFVTVLKAAVLLTSQYDLVPEILDIFEDQALEFLLIFSGRVVTVPPWSEVTAQFRRVSAWIALSAATDDERDELESKLAADFHISRKELVFMFDDMEALMSNLGMELRNG